MRSTSEGFPISTYRPEYELAMKQVDDVACLACPLCSSTALCPSNRQWFESRVDFFAQCVFRFQCPIRCRGCNQRFYRSIGWWWKFRQAKRRLSICEY